MTKRKSIVSSFGDFTKPEEPQDKSQPSSTTAQKSAVKRVGAGIVGATRRSLTDLREERDKLLESLEDGDNLLMIDAKLIDPSPYNDRLPDDDNIEFERLKSNIELEGQKVPITVRQNPQDRSRFQIVYGHRRARALKELGLDAEAILRNYSDRDLVVAQGIENANRQDLSWIEKALFVATMESEKIKPKDIKAALGVDDSQLSKFRLATNSLGAEVINAIGRAPKIGRPRWLELVGLVKSNKDRGELLKTLSADKVLELSSDEKFTAALSYFSEAKPSEVKNSTQKNLPIGDIGSVSFGGTGIKLSIEKKYAEEFHEFFGKEIDEMVSRFMKSIDEK
jgi:ParB family chromosome partitioning protein